MDKPGNGLPRDAREYIPKPAQADGQRHDTQTAEGHPRADRRDRDIPGTDVRSPVPAGRTPAQDGSPGSGTHRTDPPRI